ncbi:MAG: RNA polymerase sigma factor [Candidatus Moraniibacteriota bacterium]
MNISDEKLVENFLAGDEKAFEKLIDRYLKQLYNFTFQLVGDQNVAQDLVQEVFVKMWKHLASFDQNKKFSTWLYAIAKNAAYDWLKKKKALPFSTFENADGSNFLEILEDQNFLNSTQLWQKMDNAQDAQQFLNSLSPEMKTIFLLHFQQGFSLVEIAEILGAPSNTLKSQFRRTLLSLRKQFFAKDAPKPFSVS